MHCSLQYFKVVSIQFVAFPVLYVSAFALDLYFIIYCNVIKKGGRSFYADEILELSEKFEFYFTVGNKSKKFQMMLKVACRSNSTFFKSNI